jgi:hypothetical protein
MWMKRGVQDKETVMAISKDVEFIIEQGGFRLKKNSNDSEPVGEVGRAEQSDRPEKRH